MGSVETEQFDAIVIGGGPAGSCVALRLLQMGYRVALIEKKKFPRGQIGESLSPGIRNIFHYIEAGHLLESPGYLQGVSAQIIWERPEPVYIDAQQRGPGIVVDRSTLDQNLLQLGVERGLRLLQPAQAWDIQRVNEKWEIKVRSTEDTKTLTALLLFDARGRNGVTREERFLTSSPTLCFWTHIPQEWLPLETRVEAVRDGWLWGSPVAAKRYRIMAFTDPGQLRNRSPYEMLSQLLRQSCLFDPAKRKGISDHIYSCLVLNYGHKAPWKDNYIRLGESAFTLDPLSSTGVEKAMRVSLQAAIAGNTILQTGASELAQTYYEQQLAESIATHAVWNRNYYRAAWPGNEHIFWKLRAVEPISNGETSTFQKKYEAYIVKQSNEKVSRQIEEIRVDDVLKKLWNRDVILSGQICLEKQICVVGDLLEYKTAVHHSGFEKPVAFIGKHELVPLLKKVQVGDTFGCLINRYNIDMPLETAIKLVIQLWKLDVFSLPKMD